MKTYHAVLVMAAAVGLCGCDTLESRIARHRDYFNGLGTGKQEHLRHYALASGDTMRDVEIGMGTPHRQSTDASGVVTYVYKRSIRSIEVDRANGSFKDGASGRVTTEVCFRGDRLYRSREIVEKNVHQLSEGAWTYF